MYPRMDAIDDAGEKSCTTLQQKQWQEEQANLKKRLKLHEDLAWKLWPSCQCDEESSFDTSDTTNKVLRYVGGVDLSFYKADSSIACGGVVVIDLDKMNVVYEDFNIVHLDMPYIPGFLAFRETPVILDLLKKLAQEKPALYPQVLMVDGNGILHPRGFGLACHLGVLADIPTIGVAKNLHHVDGLDHKEVRLAFENVKEFKNMLPLIGKSGQTLGAALRSHKGCSNPIFVSIGHRISLETAVQLVRLCCKYRIPEPVRQADVRSREYLRINFKCQEM